MKRLTMIATALVLVLWTSNMRGQPGQFVTAPRCLHDRDERPADRVRREQALVLARAINAAQARAVQRPPGRYQPLTSLGTLPATPEGFDLRLYTDGNAYLFSLKDGGDSCRYGIFSDQQGTVYQLTPTAPLVAS